MGADSNMSEVVAGVHMPHDGDTAATMRRPSCCLSRMPAAFHCPSTRASTCTALRRPLQPGLRRWLNATGSLTARLQAACGPVQVLQLNQGSAVLLAEERSALTGRAQTHQGHASDHRGHVREVILCAGGVPLVYARSVLDAGHARMHWKAVRGLGGRPLAEVLFGTRAVRRSALQISHYAPRDPFTRQIARQWLAATGTPLPARGLWARSSVFTRAGMPLRVMEVMLAQLGRHVTAKQPPG
jgi:chorismate--pyruvate lyase